MWAVSLFYGLSGLWGVFAIPLAYAGALPVDPQVAEYLVRLGPLHAAVNVAGALLLVAAATALLLLRSLAVGLWTALLAFRVVFSILSLALAGLPPGQLGSAGLLLALPGFAAVIAVVFYARRLRARGVLR